MNGEPIRLLVIEDDPDYVELVRLCLDEQDGTALSFKLTSAGRLSEGLLRLAHERWDAVLVDLGLPDARGLDAVREVLRAAPGTAVLVSTSYGDEEAALQAVRLGAQDYLIKASSDARWLKRSIRYAVERVAAQEAARRAERLDAEVAERRRLDELKDRWISAFSHELRTPLTIIKGAVVDLDEDRAEPLKTGQKMLIEMARRQTERIERLIEDVLDLSRYESGRASLDRKPLDAEAVARRVANDLARAAAERSVRIDVARAPDCPPLTADADMFERLVMNLVDNAIRYAGGRVEVRLARGDDGTFCLRVGDDGAGLPPDQKELLFTRFGQLDRSRAPAGYKGTGLGLAICKEIVELHRGRISAESEPGRGTVFEARLPPDGAPTPPPMPRAAAAAPRARGGT